MYKPQGLYGTTRGETQVQCNRHPAPSTIPQSSAGDVIPKTTEVGGKLRLLTKNRTLNNICSMTK